MATPKKIMDLADIFPNKNWICILRIISTCTFFPKEKNLKHMERVTAIHMPMRKSVKLKELYLYIH